MHCFTNTKALNLSVAHWARQIRSIGAQHISHGLEQVSYFLVLHTGFFWGATLPLAMLKRQTCVTLKTTSLLN